MRRGTLEDPHLGATAIYRVLRLSTEGPVTLALSGPGIYGLATLGVEGLSVSEVKTIRESRSEYPRGVDVYLVDETGLVVGLPRSTQLEVVS